MDQVRPLKGRTSFSIRLSVGAALLVILFVAGANAAEEVSPWVAIEKNTGVPFITDHLKFINNPSNEVVQSFSILGVYQGQYWAVDAKQGNASGWENRRMYLGGQADFLHQFSVQVMVKFGETFDPVYDGLHTAFLKWKPNESVSLTFGRMDYFSFAGQEHSLGSSRISTFERGLLSNQLLPGELVGGLAEGRAGRFAGYAGVVSGSTTENFTDFAGGFGCLGGLSYQLPLFFEEGKIHLDYVFNNGNSGNNALSPYGSTVALWHSGHTGPFSLGWVLMGADGLEGRPAVFGVEAMGTWLFALNVLRQGDAFQAVLRYQYNLSDGDNGLELQKRYEQEVVPGGYGDHYQAVYMGVNYLIYGHRLKLMNGVEYSVMHDAANDGGAFNGWTFLTGVRLYF